jgi:hypothetical protein
MFERIIQNAATGVARLASAKNNRAEAKPVLFNALDAVIGTALVMAAAAGMVSGRANVGYGESRSLTSASMPAEQIMQAPVSEAAFTVSRDNVVKLGSRKPSGLTPAQ